MTGDPARPFAALRVAPETPGPGEPTVTHDLSHGPGYSCVHRMTWPEPVSRATAMGYVEANRFFGYNPAGYGGVLDPIGLDEPRATWLWRHAGSCD